MSATPKLRFLIADPLEGVRQFAQRLLEGFGFSADQVRSVATPNEGLVVASEWPPDFLITDAFASQSVDGLALFESVRMLQPGCRLGLMGFEISADLQARAKALNAQFVLKKPFGAQDLRNTLQASLEWLARERPQLAARMVKESQGRLDTQAGRRIELPAVALPKPIKIGESVQFEGHKRKVAGVVIRHGEQLLQLDGVNGFVAAWKVMR